MSKVYFTNFRTSGEINILEKLDKLITAAGIEIIDFKDKFIALKMSFAENGNLSYIRSNYIKVIAKKIIDNGGYPFLTDTSSTSKGSRNNALSYLNTARENGYSYNTTMCENIIADGINGSNEVILPAKMKNVNYARIASSIYEADIVVSITHFEGNELTCVEGSIKNLGYGCASKAGKVDINSLSKPTIDRNKCASCGVCIKNCAAKAIKYDRDKIAIIDHNKCVGCGRCINICPYNSIKILTDEKNEKLNEKICEYAYMVIKSKPSFHINFIIDVGYVGDNSLSNDASIVPNIGICASFDPVSLDQACSDLVNKSPVIKNSMLTKFTTNKFSQCNPLTNYEHALKYAEKIKLGERDYELIEI